MFGVDISGHNRNNPESIYLDSQFVIMKATEGSTFKDQKMLDYISRIGEHYNLTGRIPLLGYYHFLNGTDTAAQADNFYDTIKAFLPALLVLDIESDMEKSEKISYIIDRFETRIRSRLASDGKESDTGALIIYTNSACSKRKNFSKIYRPWWIADYGVNIYNPRTDKDWIIWQMHSCQLGTDINYSKLSLEELGMYAMG